MPKRSAGLMLFKREAGELRVLLVHPGGPFWQKRDLGSWSIPKGEYAEDEDPRAVALRVTGGKRLVTRSLPVTLPSAWEPPQRLRRWSLDHLDTQGPESRPTKPVGVAGHLVAFVELTDRLKRSAANEPGAGSEPRDGRSKPLGI